MATVKISALTEVTAPASTDVIPVVNDSTTKKVTLANAAAAAHTDGVLERSRTVAMGEWIDIPYDAGNFDGRQDMTWTVGEADVETLAYTYIGQTAIIIFAINTSTVGGTLDKWLQIQLPFTAARTGQNLARKYVGGAGSPILVSVVGGESLLKLLNLDLSNWAASTDDTYVFGMVVVPL